MLQNVRYGDEDVRTVSLTFILLGTVLLSGCTYDVTGKGWDLHRFECPNITENVKRDTVGKSDFINNLQQMASLASLFNDIGAKKLKTAQAKADQAYIEEVHACTLTTRENAIKFSEQQFQQLKSVPMNEQEKAALIDTYADWVAFMQKISVNNDAAQELNNFKAAANKYLLM
ncbi:TPA: hypothetical protein ACSTLY_000878 [Serratia fonticola]|jgi:hypothetical protein|uniref:Uncharacterized protein n=1 Tax=Serratia fonticola TaxID=47917 RepID=A0A0F7D2Q3_SERFO|nr:MULTISPECIES: hypothetical protein [Serratia]AKG71135.1 hypothetical protein WN53_19515 [Serratia fonticola]AYM90080.1 hypothetical protein D9980_05515 [Serratia sp. 3ACOL1]MBL5829081.1 hypothetical protein [Serratia fonticola]CAI1121238.1 Uncharacterised protein [Serratia fonticola]CAI1125776.1 Uncharacterised protein [Serratia fonticola]